MRPQPSLSAVLGDSIAGLEPFLDSSALKAWQVCGPGGMGLTGSKGCWGTHTEERVVVVVWCGQARILECTPKLLPFILGTLNLKKLGGYGSHLVFRQCGIGVFFLLLGLPEPFSSAPAPFAHSLPCSKGPCRALTRLFSLICFHVFSPKPSPTKLVR